MPIDGQITAAGSSVVASGPRSMTRAELRYAWGMFLIRWRYIGQLIYRREFRRAWRIAFGPTYIMPCDHKPTPGEIRLNEHMRHQRLLLPPELREQVRESYGDELPAGIYKYNVEDKG